MQCTKVDTTGLNNIENHQDDTREKSSLPKDDNIPSNDLDDEIPF